MIDVDKIAKLAEKSLWPKEFQIEDGKRMLVFEDGTEKEIFPDTIAKDLGSDWDTAKLTQLVLEANLAVRINSQGNFALMEAASRIDVWILRLTRSASYDEVLHGRSDHVVSREVFQRRHLTRWLAEGLVSQAQATSLSTSGRSVSTKDSMEKLTDERSIGQQTPWYRLTIRPFLQTAPIGGELKVFFDTSSDGTYWDVAKQDQVALERMVMRQYAEALMHHGVPPHRILF